MFGFRTLRARYRLAVAEADFLRCKDEWNEAYQRQDTRRMSIAGANLRAARNAQMRAEMDAASLRRRPKVGVAQ